MSDQSLDLNGFKIVLCIRLEMSVTKIFRISGFFLVEVGQYVGPGGASTLYLLSETKLNKTNFLGLLAQHLQD